MRRANVYRNFISRLFQPQNIVPKDAEVKSDITSRSQKLMLDLGIIRSSSPGTFYLLPLGERAFQKLIAIVDEEMMDIGAQKLLLPLLTPGELWKASGRWDTAADELFTLKDRHDKDFVLSPTHEEAVTELLASVTQLSYRQLPVRLYQVTSKFRDEMKPRFGLLRGKEFYMKDLYTFDTSEEKARETYEVVSTTYNSIFKRIGVRYVRVLGCTGVMGGSLSHEFHFPAPIGEDVLLVCEACNYGANKEVFTSNKCPQCDYEPLKSANGIEVGHTFLLGTKYSAPLKATFLNSSGKPELLQMGSYGLGISRILGAAVEALSVDNEIRWPLPLAPFTVCIIPPKDGSKESVASAFAEQLYDTLNSIETFRNDVIIDDRVQMTIGKRLFAARRTGYPFVVVIGKKSVDQVPLFEVHDVITGHRTELTDVGVVQYLRERTEGMVKL
ncbi:probable proline--tRNA ligase, mitochondrial [Anabrus simplex]|uniref:probable proline--tRNA ligase, mitochondrial n=1 Tax=Anabrus simplex TaxID=316456 RepID=UPI0034DDA86F